MNELNPDFYLNRSEATLRPKETQRSARGESQWDSEAGGRAVVAEQKVDAQWSLRWSQAGQTALRQGKRKVSWLLS